MRWFGIATIAALGSLALAPACGGSDDAGIDTAGSGGKGATGGKDAGEDASGGSGAKDAANDSSGGTGGSDASADAAGGSAGSSATGGSSGTAGATATGGAAGAAGATGCTPACDCDGDGHLMTGGSCGGDDCDDTDPQVFPGQSSYFDKPAKNGTFDYDCDGATTQEYASVINCVVALCPAGQGYFGAAPACGQSASWGVCTGALCTQQVLEQRKQACR